MRSTIGDEACRLNLDEINRKLYDPTITLTDLVARFNLEY